MSIVISGALVITTFLLVSLLTFNAMLGTSTSQSTSLMEASDSRADQVTGEISINSVSALDSGDGTNMTLGTSNKGAISYAQISNMDVLARYTSSTGDLEVKRLSYVCRQLCGDSNDPGDNQWTISSVSPDSFNPKMWDPDETATIVLRTVPVVKSGTSAAVVVVVPGGVTDLAYVSN